MTAAAAVIVTVSKNSYCNMSVLSLVPRLSTWRCPHLLLSAGADPQQSIDICRRRTPRSAANPPHAAAAVDRRDRRTDTTVTLTLLRILCAMRQHQYLSSRAGTGSSRPLPGLYLTGGAEPPRKFLTPLLLLKKRKGGRLSMYLCISKVVDFNSQNFDPPP